MPSGRHNVISTGSPIIYDRAFAPHAGTSPNGGSVAPRVAESQANEHRAAGEDWQHEGLVFTTQLGAALDAANVPKMFKRVCRESGIGDGGRHASCAPPSSAS